MVEVLVYLGLGAIAGTLAGLLGVGGGLVIVPVLAWSFASMAMAPQVIMHVAIGTSLATIVVTSMSSVYAHHRRGAVLWPLFRQLMPGIAIGALVGAAVADALATTELRLVFGVFELIVAAQMGFSLLPDAHRDLPGRLGQALAGSVIGGISAIVGIGGGTMTVPYLVWCGVNMRNAVATSAACGLPIAVAGATGFIISGWNDSDVPTYASGYVYWPAFLGIVIASALFAPFGSRLAHTLPVATLRRVFALLLFILGVVMLQSR